MEVFEKLAPLSERVQQELERAVWQSFPTTLRDPILYFLKTPGKKIRPLFNLLSCQAVGGNVEDALPAAVGLELFHDFTLIHDDIMDQDELRRGTLTIHKKWDVGTAILAGDALIGMAYRSMQQAHTDRLVDILHLFSEAVIKVCEGQALDKEFENRPEVSEAEYLDMISKKTAWLFKISCQIGALIGGGSEAQVQAMAEFGYQLGIGFQIQDDLLDFVADESKLGKHVGSDLQRDKKTYVTLKYRELIEKHPHRAEQYPSHIYQFTSLEELKAALYQLGLVEETQQVVENYISRALRALETVQPLNPENHLYQITQFLRQRQY